MRRWELVKEKMGVGIREQSKAQMLDQRGDFPYLRSWMTHMQTVLKLVLKGNTLCVSPVRNSEEAIENFTMTLRKVKYKLES